MPGEKKRACVRSARPAAVAVVEERVEARLGDGRAGELGHADAAVLGDDEALVRPAVGLERDAVVVAHEGRIAGVLDEVRDRAGGESARASAPSRSAGGRRRGAALELVEEARQAPLVVGRAQPVERRHARAVEGRAGEDAAHACRRRWPPR